MSDPQVKVLDNGPYLVTGAMELVDGEGKPIKTETQFALCRCGGSKNKPFCDGTHKSNGFSSVVRAPQP